MAKKKAKKKGTGAFTTVLLIIIFVVGLSLVLYPTISNYVNSLHASKAIATYEDIMSKMTAEEYQRIWESAVDYNAVLSGEATGYVSSASLSSRYPNELNIDGHGLMGYVEIPAIDVTLPVYHGTEANTLQVAVGHLDWTSLPIGGESTHAALSGHRGLPSAKLFTDLDRLIVGDIFMIRVLNEILTYEVDQILIVEPQDVKDLNIVPGEDLCTLVTCTPYGINSHRLLVRGHRIATDDPTGMRVISEAVVVEPLIVAPLVALPLLLFLLILVIFRKPLKDKKHILTHEDLKKFIP